MNTWIPGKDLMKNHYQKKNFFYNELNNEGISDKDYKHYQKVWEVFKIKKSI